MMNYDNLFSKNLLDIKPSGIRKFFDLLSERSDVTALTVGQPDFVTPRHIIDAGISSLEEKKTYYTSNKGTAELRLEIANYLKRRFGLSYSPEDELFATVGGSEAIDIAIRSFINPGDEVIIPTPAFVCYEPLTKMAGGVPVIIKTDIKNGFKLTPEALRAHITEKTKLIVLPYPNNPTGAVLNREELTALSEVIKESRALVLSDEIYAELTYTGNHVSVASIEGMRERTVIVSGFSKAYAMTGWRLGYIAAPRQLLEEMLKLHQYAIMCAPTASQFAGTEAMRYGDDDVEYMRNEYNRRRIMIYEGLLRIGLPSAMPEGAFYIFPCVSGFGLSSEEFAERLLNEEGCAIVPGTAFGDAGEGYARISYAYSTEHINEALLKIERFVKRLKEEKA